jgi:hypothetical protein
MDETRCTPLPDRSVRSCWGFCSRQVRDSKRHLSLRYDRSALST